MTVARPRMVAQWAKCRGCRACQLICSFRHDRVFNPTKAALRVTKTAGETEFEVYFTPLCDDCGVCIRYCLYGALSRERSAAGVAAGEGGDEL